jgi:hypothetical protein
MLSYRATEPQSHRACVGLLALATLLLVGIPQAHANEIQVGYIVTVKDGQGNLLEDIPVSIYQTGNFSYGGRTESNGVWRDDDVTFGVESDSTVSILVNSTTSPFHNANYGTVIVPHTPHASAVFEITVYLYPDEHSVEHLKNDNDPTERARNASVSMANRLRFSLLSGH